MKSIITCARETPKKINEDHCERFENLNLSIQGVIVADGIGSHYLPQEGSYFCTSKLKELLVNLHSIEELDFNKLFKDVAKALDNDILANGDITIPEAAENSFGTTLICAVELEDCYKVAYVGNGSIWHIRGNFNNFSPVRFLPWNAINLLNPHTVEENGKESLYRYFSYKNSNCIPSVITLSKDTTEFGEIILITTDGFHSADQCAVGKDGKGKLWVKGEDSLPRLLSPLSELLKADADELQEVDLNANIERFLAETKESRLMDDDTSLGIILSAQAMRYHKSLSVTIPVEKEHEINPD